MWHRSLLLLALIGCAPALVVAKSYTRLAGDYHVGLGLAFTMGGIPRSNVNVMITPVYESGDRREYERARASFQEAVAKTRIDRDGTVFALLLAPLEMPDEYLRDLTPVAWVGPFGVWAPSNLPGDLLQEVEQALVRMNGTTLSRFQQTGLPLTTGGAADMRAKARAAQVAFEPAAPPAAPASTAGPQIKGYDPREANRVTLLDQPPPLKHIDPKGTYYVKGIATWPDFNVELQRERAAREARAAAAKKPRLTMADYARKAALEKAEFQVRKARAAADHQQVLNWLINDRNTKEAEIRQRLQKRREYVDGQANRKDAVTQGDAFVEGGVLKVHLRNRTDISLSITIDLKIFDRKGERVSTNPRILSLLPLDEKDVYLIDWYPSYDPKVTYEIFWKSEPIDYQTNY